MKFKNGNKILTNGGKVIDYSVTPSISYDLLLTSEEGNFTKDGGNLVSQWTDTSGNGNNVSQGTTNNQPTWVSSVDGSPAVQFDGSTDFMILDPSVLDLGSDDFTIELWNKFDDDNQHYFYQSKTR